jgi:hypothetical protein
MELLDSRISFCLTTVCKHKISGFIAPQIVFCPTIDPACPVACGYSASAKKLRGNVFPEND